jgi:hypothetical protein
MDLAFFICFRLYGVIDEESGKYDDLSEFTDDRAAEKQK